MGFIDFFRSSGRKPSKRAKRLTPKKNLNTSRITRIREFFLSWSFIAGGAFVALLSGIFAYLFFTTAVFIEDVDIAQSLQGRGFDGASLTEEAVYLMPSVAASRVATLSKPHTKLMQIIERKAENLDSDQVCNLMIAQMEPPYEVYLRGLKRGLLSSEVPDKIVSKNEESLRKMAFWIRKKVGWDALMLRPQLHVDSDGRSFVAMRTTPVIGEPRIKYVGDLKDAPRIVASLLVDYLSPEILALEMLSEGADDYSVPWQIAAQYLRDKQAEYRISVATTTRFLEASRSTADTWTWYLNTENYNRRLLKKLDFSVYGESEPLVKFSFAQRLAVTDRLKKQKSGERIDDSALYDAYVKPYSNDLEKSLSGQLVLIIMDAKYGRKLEFERRLNVLLDNNLPTSLPGISGPVTKNNIAFLGLSIMLASGNIDAAKKFVNSERFQRWASEDKFEEATRQALMGALDASDGSLVRYKTLVGLDFFKNPCAEFLLVGQIQGLREQGLIVYEKSRPLLDLLLESFRRLEKAGIRSFDFYEQWAELESLAGNPQASMLLHAKSLKHDGQHSWALLNWGKKAYDTNDFETAKEKYLASLGINVIPNAVHGYLNTLWKRNEPDEFLDAFNRYGASLQKFEASKRMPLEAYALEQFCKAGRKPKVSLLAPGEPITIEGKTYEFHKENCAFTLKT